MTCPACASAELVDRAVELLTDGASYRQVAETLGCSRNTLRRRLPGYGWSYREAGEYRAFVRTMEARIRRGGQVNHG